MALGYGVVWLMLALAISSGGAATRAAPTLDLRCYDETGTMRLYDPACCCTAGWCGPLDDRLVAEVPGGWRLTVPEGGHVRLRPGTYFVPEARASLSPDGRWHACGVNAVFCLLRVGGGV
jgi:hypothetical protein